MTYQAGNPLKREELAKVAKEIFENSEWDKVVAKSNSVMTTRQVAATKCFNYTQTLVSGFMCGICQPENLNRFNAITVKKPLGDVTTFYSKFTLNEAIGFANACEDYFKVQNQLFPYINSISTLYSYNKRGGIVVQTPFVLTAATLGQEYTGKIFFVLNVTETRVGYMITIFITIVCSGKTQASNTTSFNKKTLIVYLEKVRSFRSYILKEKMLQYFLHKNTYKIRRQYRQKFR